MLDFPDWSAEYLGRYFSRGQSHEFGIRHGTDSRPAAVVGSKMKAYRTKMISHLAILVFLPPGLSLAAGTNQPARRLPPQPWHTADITWYFTRTTPHFESLDVDVTIDRDVSTNVNLYIAPCGMGKLNDIEFYGGLQSNANGWPSKDEHVRHFIGKGGIFSRWGERNLSVDSARGTNGTH